MDHTEIRLLHPRQLWTRVEKRAHSLHVTPAHRGDEAIHRGAVDERLELRPALEAVGAREHELRVVQREGLRSARDSARDLGGGRSFAGANASSSSLA